MAAERGVGTAPSPWTLLVPVLLLVLLLVSATRAAEECSVYPSEIAGAEPSEECRRCLLRHYGANVTNATEVEFSLASNHSTLLAKHLHKQKVCKLWAKHRAITSVDPGAFQNMACLRRVILGANRLVQLNPHTFASNVLLVQLMLDNNNLHLPPKKPFLNSSSLQILNISLCNISVVYATTFQGLPNLKVLLLRSNDIRTLHEGAFTPLKNLKVLDVSKNKIATIDFVSQLKLTCFYAVQNPQLNLTGLLSTFRNLNKNTILTFSKEVCCCSDHCNLSASGWISKCEKCSSKKNATFPPTAPPSGSISISTAHYNNDVQTLPSSILIYPESGPTEAAVPRHVPIQTGVATGLEKKQTQTANLAVILLSSIFSFLILLQSAFIVFLLIKAKRKEAPVYVEVTNRSVGSPPLVVYGVREQVTDLDAESCSHLSLNPVYETIPE